jgi:hypothetical protein
MEGGLLRTTLKVHVSLALVTALVILLAPTASAAPSDVIYGVDAYGTYAFGRSAQSTTALSGPSAWSILGCSYKAGVHKENTVATVAVAPVISTGRVRTTADSVNSGGVKKAIGVSHVDAVALLDPEGSDPPMITASSSRAVSTTSFDGSSFSISAAGSEFSGLNVNGQSQSITPPPNTTISLPGVGRVILNQQIPASASNSASLTVIMIHVFVTVPNNPLGIPTGTEILVSKATSRLTNGVAGYLSGLAYGSQAFEKDHVTSGPSSLLAMPCLGGSKRNTTASSNAPQLFSAGNLVTTADGSVSPSLATGQMTASVESLDVLSGVVRADAVKAVAKASSDGSGYKLSQAGSTFLNLKVGNRSYSSPGANTSVPIRGLGTLWLRRVIRTANSIEVRMIELIVTRENNPFGLAVGTHIQIAVAKAAVL